MGPEPLSLQIHSRRSLAQTLIPCFFRALARFFHRPPGLHYGGLDHRGCIGVGIGDLNVAKRLAALDPGLVSVGGIPGQTSHPPKSQAAAAHSAACH